MVIDMEAIVKELCPRTLQATENKGIRRSILNVLQVRFGSVSEETKDKLETITSLDALEILLRGATTEQTFEEFKRLLK